MADVVVRPEHEDRLRAALKVALEHGHGVVTLLWPLERLQDGAARGTLDVALEHRSFSTKRACASCGTSFPEPDPRLFSYNSKHGWCPACFGTGLKLTGFDAEQSGEEIWWNAWYEGETTPCEACHGQRLNRTALAVRFADRSIAELAQMPVSDARQFFQQLELSGRGAEIARDAVAEIRSRLSFLEEVGLGYLALDRAAPTLSGGEAQRIRLAAQLGSNLQGVAYVLDEPTIGLHPRDNRILLDALQKLEAKGNTLVVVEHDEDTIRRAAHLIDIGPAAGVRGGRVVAQGSLADLINAPESTTGKWLKTPLQHPMLGRRGVDAEQRPHRGARRAPAQPAQGRRVVPARSPDRRHRRVGQRQVVPRARRAAREPAGPGRPARPAGSVGRLRRDRRLAVARPRARGRPDADRQDAALVPGDLRRLLGRDPQALRRHAGGARARLRRRAASRSTPRGAAARRARARACGRSR